MTAPMDYTALKCEAMRTIPGLLLTDTPNKEADLHVLYMNYYSLCNQSGADTEDAAMILFLATLQHLNSVTQRLAEVLDVPQNEVLQGLGLHAARVASVHQE